MDNVQVIELFVTKVVIIQMLCNYEIIPIALAFPQCADSCVSAVNDVLVLSWYDH